MHRFYGFVLLAAGIGFMLLGVYPLYTNGAGSWESMLLTAEACVFGYLLTRTGYRMSRGERF
jgi:hypothetical protein